MRWKGMVNYLIFPPNFDLPISTVDNNRHAQPTKLPWYSDHNAKRRPRDTVLVGGYI